MDDLHNTDSGDDDGPADMDDIEIIEVYEASSDEDDDGSDEAADDDAAGQDNGLPVAVPSASFLGHEGSVFVCAVSGDGQLVVTGGQDDRGFVWRLDTGEPVFECGGHGDSVTGAAFNHDSTLVATADMAGAVRVWGVGDRQKVWDFETGSDLHWIDWHPRANVLLAGTVDGTVWMWQVPSGQCKTLRGPHSGCCAGRALSDGKRAVAGYEDGSVRVWDLKGASVVHALTGAPQAHSTPVTCLATGGGDLVASAALDVRLLHAGTGRLLATLAAGGPTSGAGDDSVEALCFDGQQRLLAAGMLSGCLSLWDLGTLVERQRCAHPQGVSRCLWRGPHTVVTGCLDGVVRAWDTRVGGAPVTQWRGPPSGELLDLALSPDGQAVVTACNDGACAVYRFSD